MMIYVASCVQDFIRINYPLWSVLYYRLLLHGELWETSHTQTDPFGYTFIIGNGRKIVLTVLLPQTGNFDIHWSSEQYLTDAIDDLARAVELICLSRQDKLTKELTRLFILACREERWKKTQYGYLKHSLRNPSLFYPTLQMPIRIGIDRLD